MIQDRLLGIRMDIERLLQEGAAAGLRDRHPRARARALLRWHRIDAVEIWHHYAGAPLELLLSGNPPETEEIIRIGTDIIGGERPQGLVKPGQWQAARSLGEWTLVGCTVSPAFEFEHFEILGD